MNIIRDECMTDLEFNKIYNIYINIQNSHQKSNHPLDHYEIIETMFGFELVDKFYKKLEKINPEDFI